MIETPITETFIKPDFTDVCSIAFFIALVIAQI